MGTIVVVKKNSNITIASDCCNVRDTGMRTNLNISHGCVLRFADSYIGLNSSVAFQQAFEGLLNDWKTESTSTLNSREEIRLFFTRVHEAFRQYQYMYVNYQQGQEFEWTPMNALIANSSGIYKIDSTRAVYEFTKFWAIGTGEAYALGAMSAAYDLVDSADEIANLGLSAVRELEVDYNRKPEVFSIAMKKSVLKVASTSKVRKLNRSSKPRNRSK